MIDCEQFEKYYSIDPNGLDTEMLVHKENCKKCLQTVEQIRKLDRQIRAALEVEVPADLVQMLTKLPGRGSRHGKVIRQSIFGGFALAASFFLGVSLTTYRSNQSAPQPLELQQLVYNHIIGKPQALNALFPVKEALIKTTLKDFGVALKNPLGDVLHITLCPIADTHGLHIVIQGKTGPVTLLFLPTKTIHSREGFHKGRFAGYIEPAPTGVIAVVGEKDELLDGIEEMVENSIEWL